MGGFIKGLTEIKKILLSEQTERLDEIMQVKKMVKLDFDLIKSCWGGSYLNADWKESR